MITFHKKIKPAEEYFKFEPCCEKMNLYKSLFMISNTDIEIKNSDSNYRSGDGFYSVRITYCPFCGEKFEIEL